MSEECGLIFNRHKWEYPHPDFRVCKKCGEMQQVNYGVAGDLPWMRINTLEEFTKELNMRQARDILSKEADVEYQKEREKAKKWLTTPKRKG